MTLFRTRPRRAAVALFAMAGALLGIGGAVTPAKADPDEGPCLRISVWTYESQEGRSYQVDRKCVTAWEEEAYTPVGVEDDTLPPGTPSGAGAEVWWGTP